MCEHRVSIRLGPRSVGGAWARVSPEIIDAIDCESLTVYHLFRQTGQTWSAARPRRLRKNRTSTRYHTARQAVAEREVVYPLANHQ